MLNVELKLSRVQERYTVVGSTPIKHVFLKKITVFKAIDVDGTFSIISKQI